MRRIILFSVICCWCLFSNAQNVGIGTPTPAYKLDVKNGSINTDSLYRIGGNAVLSIKGNGNFFAGTFSGTSNTSGYSNTATGYASLYLNNTGVYNTASGYTALYHNTTGSSNTAFGASALSENTIASNNTAMGTGALTNNKAGDLNTAIGAYALSTQQFNNGGIAWETGNTAVGAYALRINNPTSASNGFNNTAIGSYALFANSTGWDNTGTGVAALYTNTTGYQNTAIGRQSLFYNTIGYYNAAVGYKSLRENSSGTNNTAIGHVALNLNTTGSFNVAAGSYALITNTTGGSNTAIGNSAYFGTADLYNTTCIGNSSGGMANVDSRIEIGNPEITWIGGQVGWSTYSDGRIKDNITENVPGLNFITRLRPVTYNLNVHRQNQMVFKQKKEMAEWKSMYDIEKIKMTGLIAQEVEQAAKECNYDFSGLEVPDGNGKTLYSLRYSDFIMPLVKAVQEQQAMITALQKEIEELKKKIK